MKKTLIFLTAFCISLAAFAQTDYPNINNFISKYQELDAKYQKSYEEKNYEQAILQIQQMVAFVEDIKLSDEETKEFPHLLNLMKANTYYNLACSYSLNNQTKEAIDAFEKSVEFGYSEYSHAKTDSDLDNIRKEEKFVALMDTLKQFDKLVILQNAGGYEKSDTVGLPHFYYETPKNARLQDVKKYFKLDSIAGNGDEISKILNLMYWIHNNITHDGSNYALAEFNSIDLYHYHKATGKGINCRHLAIALNEMYLSMGFKSRYVTCFPKDENDNDCHVINSVWVDSLQKWIWIDPTFAAYVKDETGNFLSINEVRERLIDGRPVVLNEDANWNNQNKQTVEGYLMNYMAKNLYWLQVPINSIFNPESRYRNNVNTYISLFPIGYGEDHKYSKDGVATHDPDYFWQAPISE